LLHGLGSSCHIWDLVAPLLAECGLQVVTPDQRGHGQSAKPTDGYDMATLAADAYGLSRDLGLVRPVVVGHSWGAWIVLAYAAAYPQDLAGIVLVDGGVLDLRSRAGATWESVLRDLAQPDLSTTQMADQLARAAEGELRFLDPGFRESFLRSLMEEQPDGTIRMFLTRANHRLTLRGIWEQDLPATMARIGAAGTPALAVLAMQSHAEGRGAEFLAAKRSGAEALLRHAPQARVIWMEETIHDIPLQRPAELAEVIAAMAAGPAAR
jgi:pimeloyl-ACP methyl ester carboxylesterase